MQLVPLIRLALSVAAALLALPAGYTAAVADARFDISGSISGYSKSARVSPVDLVPAPRASGFTERSGGADAIIQIDGHHRNLRLGGQLRLDSREVAGKPVTVDEAYAELLLGEHTFISAGRRLLSYGQSFGINPADIFHDRLKENSIYPATRARNATQGVDMATFDILFDNGGTLSLVHAPHFDRRGLKRDENLGVLRYSGFAADGALDYSLAMIGGRRPGAGVSLTYGFGDASVLYVDGTLRRGRTRRAISGVGPDGHLQQLPVEDDRKVPFATLGIGHTRASGLTFNLEYTHDGGGYSSREWQRFSTAIDAATPVRSPVQRQNLARLNGLLNHWTLRQNHGFARIAHDELFGSSTSGAFSVLHGLDSSSGSLALRFEYFPADHIAIGVRLARNYGGKNNEFTLRPETGSIAIYSTLVFPAE